MKLRRLARALADDLERLTFGGQGHAELDERTAREHRCVARVCAWLRRYGRAGAVTGAPRA